MATENADHGRRPHARRDDDRQRRLRAARAGPLPLPRLARRRDRPGSSRTCCASTASRSLRGGEWTIAPEHIEVGSFIGLAAVTNSDLTIDGVAPQGHGLDPHGLQRLGIEVELGDDWLRVPPHQELVIQNDLGDQVPKIEDGPWPAFPADLTSIAVAVATQAWGTILIFEKMFENRLFFVDKLVSMGARIIVCDPHRVVVSGPSRLYGQRLTSPDIRAGMAMLIAALCANGQLGDRQRRRDRPRLRADRRAPPRGRRADRARRGVAAELRSAG